MQEDLKQAHRLAEMYRGQCITMETELSQIREKGDVGREIFKVQMCTSVKPSYFMEIIKFVTNIFFLLNLNVCRSVRTKWPRVSS